MSNRREQIASQDLGSSLGASTAAAIDQMMRWPFWFTGATMDLMLQGMERMTGQTNWAMGSEGPRGSGRSGGTADTRGAGSMNVSTSGGSNRSAGWNMAGGQAYVSSGDDQDLGGDDLKYVLWSIVFCKPGYETVLEPLQSDIVSYSADGASYAAVKIAKYLEKTRNGRTERPQIWTEKGYPDASSGPRRESSNVVGGNTAAPSQERGWRIPAEDHKYIKFVYRVERRFPKEEPEVTRIERVTIERGVDTRTTSAA
jgi:hypothetical protein